MERQFSARFDIMSYMGTDATSWDIMGYVVDNTGNFFAGNVNVGDILYLDGSMLGMQVLRYRITAIDYSKLSGTELYASIKWDMGSEDPIEPYVGLSGIIGRSTSKLKIASLPSTSINLLDESFVTAIKNYENTVIVDNLAPVDSPELTGKPLTPTADITSDDKQIANTEWVNDRIDNIDGVRVYVALEDIAAFKVLYIDDSDSVGLADSRNVNYADRVIGISMESKLAGEQVTVMLKGELTNEGWDFAQTGQLIFVGRRGEITLDPSTITGFIQQIGMTADNHTIALDIEEAVLLQ